jgi:ribosomal protein L37E
MPSNVPAQIITKKTKRLYKCQRCGGQVLHFSSSTSCLQCGATHTKEGKIVQPTLPKN